MQNEIITVKDLLEKKELKIPEYQRPYKWTIKNVSQLIDDILHFSDKKAYRLGTVVLHKDENDTKINIVDGQQRTITLFLLVLAVQNDKKLKDMIKNNFSINWEFSNPISQYNIQNNYNEIVRRLKDFDEQKINFLLNHCEVVTVTLKSITESFQFFDSQNARGKDLEPHDLLKAYHLREMRDISEEEKIDTIDSWEDIDSDELAVLFNNYLFRIRNWSKGKNARFFTKKDVEVFKGINPNNKQYPYGNLYKIAHHYIDSYNSDYHRKIDLQYLDYPFQIDQNIINGKRFFELVAYYFHKKKGSFEENEIIKLIDTYDGKNRTGDKYVRNLFDCAVLYYRDKFGDIEITKAIEKIFIWAYKLRLTQHSVQIASMDNYALETKLFTFIREATSHKEIVNMSINSLENINIVSTKTKKLEEKFEEMGYAK
ncbi:MAG: hypothetical protein A2W82_04960 [Sulfurimonas sp. RIFCSPLOWO2_12_36_12]|uniref:DUF262 domain-containing protein n=1 Tax=Sulfurimonas sp. RIFCSPLOWO2_12_36_12 TaxID=1802253 RepID=UPI0008B9779D|nr:DUF262 domain-containing protein [Sulfurimonas sp. RIFCSPLOWO2_12_36_12]OHE00713.1 MAG: hypothetical protein A3J26_05465 [Sulfurimonas sp. RIFCSPLOWO2_02_FULL_36_28]OHE02042.1 MAG: hypothetical protein A2W82_04960 [Sulfurimonas sp. RIFCSPLOWO2_12_36_12]